GPPLVRMPYRHDRGVLYEALGRHRGGGLGGAAAGGAVGSAWGVAAATVSGSAVWWLQLRSALREHAQEPIREVRTS
ncbi:hypothetical protein ACWCQX_32300, partial [Streptomyces sp. NPDC002346]